MTHSHQTIDETRFPASGTMEEKARFLLQYAVLAPSSQNTQPWRFAVRGPTIEVYADPERWLQVADASRRELQISVGCALENLLIAAEHFQLGHRTELTPDRGDEHHVASVHLEPEGEPSPFRPADLFDAIARRTTTRDAYEARPVPEEALERLRACAPEEGIRLLLTGDPEAKAWVEQLIAATDERQTTDPRWQREVETLVASGDLGERVSAFRCDAESFASSPIFGVILSLEDDVASRVRTGQVFERLYLTTTALGLGLQPVSQLLQLGPPMDALGDVLGIGAAIPQQPFRLGFGASHPRSTPRRPVEEVLVARWPGSPG